MIHKNISDSDIDISNYYNMLKQIYYNETINHQELKSEYYSIQIHREWELNEKRIITYNLSLKEIQDGIFISKAQTFMNMISGDVKNQRFSLRDDLSIVIQGCYGEIGISNILKLPSNPMYVYPRSTSYDNHDARMITGESIDIKCVINPKKDLLVLASKKYNPADLYILSYLKSKSLFLNLKNKDNIQIFDDALQLGLMDVQISFIGIATKEMVFQEKNEYQMVGKMFYRVPYKSLLSLKTYIDTKMS